MPQVIPFIAGYAGQALFGSQLVSALFTFASAAAVGNYQRRKAQRNARDRFNASLTDRTAMAALTQGARSRVYGRARNVDGVIFKGTWGADNRYYTLVVAVAGHEVDAIEDVYFNDVLVTLDGSGYVQTAPYAVTERRTISQDISISAGAGNVTLSQTPVSGTVKGSYSTYIGTQSQSDFTTTVTVVGSTASVSGIPDGVSTVQVSYQYDAVRSFARVRKYLGAAGQDLSSVLSPNFPAITSADKFQGIALLLVDLEYSQDAYPNGVPNISAVMRGAKILDTRTSTTAWTQNNAMIGRDWALYAYGGGMSSAQFEATACETAANACDVDSTFTTGATPVTMDTYQAGIVIPLDANPAEAMDEIVESMAGRWGWAGGKLRMVAGAFRSSVATITEDWCTDVADIEIVSAPPRSELVNGYRATIANRDNAYIAEPMPELAPSAYVTSDGQKLLREVQFGGVTKREHALHIAGVLLRDARQGLSVKLPCNMRAWQLELFDVVAVTLPTFGWSAKTFEVLGWEYTLAGGVLLTLKETVASIYTVDAAFTGLENEDNTDLPDPTVVEQITGFAVANDTATQQDGSSVARVRATWTAVTDINVLQSGWVEVQYLRLGLASGDALYGKWLSTLVRGDQSAAYISDLKPGGVYLFMARAINTIGVRGKWSSHQIIAVGSGSIGGGNLLANSGFEVDSNADGVADSWLSFSSGTTGTVTNTTPTSGMRGSKAQRVDCTALGTTPGTDRIGIEQALVQLGSLAGTKVAVSCAFSASAQTDMQIQLVWKTSGGSTISTDTFTAPNPASLDLRRVAFTATVPATCTQADLYAWVTPQTGRASSACAALWDDVQLQSGAVPTDWAPRADEILAGAVGTTQLASGAATAVTVLTQTSLQFGAGNSNVSATSLNHTFDEATTYEIAFTASVVIDTNAANGTLTFSFSASGTGAFNGDGVPVFSHVTTGGNGVTLPISHSLTLVLSGAGPWSFTPLWTRSSTSNVYTINSMHLRITKIKR